MKDCKSCGIQVQKRKNWGYVNLCEDCDTDEPVNKSMAVMVADGKTDYHCKVIENPTNAEREAIRAAGAAHDPRSQLRAINKVSN
jgi:hypothetical protein